MDLSSQCIKDLYHPTVVEDVRLAAGRVSKHTFCLMLNIHNAIIHKLRLEITALKPPKIVFGFDVTT